MAAQDPSVFIGSSAEGKDYADYLQVALENDCEAAVWDQGAFGLSENGLQALCIEAERVDFAILVLTPDDLTVKRGVVGPSARDNVIFEAGLFAGALGPERTFLVHASDVELNLPTDLAGITTCSFRSVRKDGNVRAAVNTAAVKVREAMARLGLRGEHPVQTGEGEVTGDIAPLAEERAELERELDALATAAEAQGWTVKTRNESVFRLLSRDGIRFSFTIGTARQTRIALREFARELNEKGLRMNRTLLLPVGAVPPPARKRARERPKADAGDQATVDKKKAPVKRKAKAPDTPSR